MMAFYKGKAKYKFGYLVAVLLCTITVYAGDFISFTKNFNNSGYFENDFSGKKDTIPNRKRLTTDSVKKAFEQRLPVNPVEKHPQSDTVIIPKADSFSVKLSKDTLDAPITYHAEDSMVLDVPGKLITLYGKQAKVTYNDNELTAPSIAYDQKTNLVKAHLVRDSLGNVVSFASFKQADFTSSSDSIWFSLKSGKGRTKSTYFKQDEMFVHAEISKKVTTGNLIVINARNAIFTTCNYDTPHFAFVAGKVKFINKKMAITGPVHPEIEGIPLPIALPFGIYPLSQGRHSGILAPTFSANEQLGLSLEGLGYYKVLNDNWDVTFRSTLYSYGGWTASINPNYYKRYHYRGNLSFDLQRFKYNFKGDPDYSSSKTMNIRWSHSSDTKARPGVNFNANVNAGSSKFNSLVPNSPQRNFQNQLNSSITYSKIWKDQPYSLTVSANHNQNTSQKLINVNLPDVAFNVNTQYPFRRKEVIGDYKWYENIGVALNTNAKSLSSFYDTLGNIGKQLIDKLQWGAAHSIPISLSLPEVGHLQFSPNISYSERWYQQKFIRSWNGIGKKVDTAIHKGLYTAREMSFGMGISTRIFGMFEFGKNSRVQAIRHEIRPSISISYKPDMNAKNWYSTQIDTLKNAARFSVYDGSIFGGYGEGKFGGISFGIDNNLQMKTQNKKDTGEAAIKKISLIDGFSLNGSYNFMADSFRLSTFSISARSNLFEKINISASASLDPYQTNIRGERINKLIWAKNPVSLGRLTSGNISLQSQFKGGDKKEKLPSENLQQTNPNTGMPLDEYQQESALIQNNPGQYANFNIPWSVSFSYSLQYNKLRKSDYSGYYNLFTQSVNWTGTLNLTPKWQLGVNGYYNITSKELGTISMNISREMHCWQMAINLSPVGKYRFFNISISPKSGLLRDLKINRTRYFYDL
jgi:LPS-assembly protein